MKGSLRSLLDAVNRVTIIMQARDPRSTTCRVEGCNSLSIGSATESRDDRSPQSRAIEPRRRPLAIEHRSYSRCNRIDVLGVDKFSECATINRIDRPIAIASNDRRSTAERFEENDPESLSGARHREYVSKPVVVGKLIIRDKAREGDAALDAKLLRKRLYSASIVALAHQNESNRSARSLKRRQCAHDAIVSLVPLTGRKPRDREDDALVVSDRIAVRKRLWTRPVLEARLVESVMQDEDFAFVDSAEIENAPLRPVAHGHHSIRGTERAQGRARKRRMNVDSMRNNSERNPHRPLREVRDRRKVHMSRDDLVRAIAKNAGHAS